jgi:chlorophyllide a reductase subunit Z
MDKVEATPAKREKQLPWQSEAMAELDRLVEAEPVLVRISAAKRLRDTAEKTARLQGDEQVRLDHLERAKRSLMHNQAA